MGKKRATDETLGLIHTIMAERLLARIQDTTVPLTPQEINSISKFLKDNEITASIEEGSPHARLVAAFSGMDAASVGIFNQAAEG